MITLSAEESGGEMRVTGKVSETSFACVIIAVLEIGNSTCRINKNIPTISYWRLFVLLSKILVLLMSFYLRL